jgi:glycosyltransferase involved in cell wall biosynthesis
MPRVSIGLTVSDSERHLEECLQSLLAQTFEDFELIISDDASSDRTQRSPSRKWPRTIV